jgi:peptidoglycan/LPS O-acetylase OafA/YrhL
MVVGYHISLASRDMRLWSLSNNPLLTSFLLAGGAGVTLFFVLSGLLLFLPYAKALLSEQPWPGTRQFYLRRALRIIPGYYFSLAVIVLLAQPQYLEPRHWREFILFPLLLMDSAQTTFQQLNGPYWTLAIEWQFYLLLPWVALGISLIVRRVQSEKRLWAVVGCLLGLIGWGLFSRWWGSYFVAHPTETLLAPRGVFNVVVFFTYGYNGKYLEDFAVGMLIGLGYMYMRDPTARVNVGLRLRQAGPWLWTGGVLLLLFMAMQHYTLEYGYRWPVLPALFLMPGWLLELGFSLGFGLCILAILSGSAWLRNPFAWTPLRWIGLVSYSMYIWHLPLLGTFIHHIGPSLVGLPSFITYSLFWVWVAVVIIPFSFVLYVLIEKPGMRLSDRLRGQMSTRRARARVTKKLSPRLDSGSGLRQEIEAYP